MKNIKNILVLIAIVLVGVCSCTKEKNRDVKDEDYGGKDKGDNVTVIAGEDKDAINEAYAQIEAWILEVTTQAELDALLPGIKGLSAVEDAWIDGGQLSVKFKKGGISSWIVIEETIKSSSTKTAKSMVSLLKAVDESTVDGTGRKVLLVNQESEDENSAEHKTSLNLVKTKFEEKKFEVNLLKSSAFDLDFASKELSKYDLIFFVTRGSYIDGLHWLCTGKDISGSENIDYILNNLYEEWKSEKVSDLSFKEKRGGKLAIYKYLAISEKFISSNYTSNKFDKTFVYSSAGKMFEGPTSTEQNSVGKAFVDNGAAVFADWSTFHADAVKNGATVFLKFLEAKSLETIIADMEADGVDMRDGSGDLYLKYYPGTGKDYRINNAPNAFALTFPKKDAEDISISLTFKWNKAKDINGDDVKYFVKLFEKGDESRVVMETASDLKWTKGLTDNSCRVSKGLKINTEYSWYVTATDQSGAAKKSAVYSFKTINEMPEILCVTPTDGEKDVNRNISLKWKPDPYIIENKMTYKVYLSETADLVGGVLKDGVVHDVDAKDGKYEDVRKGLDKFKTYYWQVVAVDGAGNEFPGKDIWSFTTSDVMNTPPTAPVLIDPTDKSTSLLFTDINFSWKASEDENGDVLNYTVWYRVKGSGEWKKFKETTAITLKEELKANTEYEWKVSVFDGYTLVESDDIFSFETRINTPPSAPILTAPWKDEANLGMDVRLEWDKATDLDGETPWYEIVIFDESDNEILREELTDNFYEFVGEDGKNYSWHVWAHDNNFGKTLSDEWEFHIKDLPDLSADGLIFVEGGDFKMGDSSGDSDENDVHDVTLSDFYMANKEVTHKEFIEFLKTVSSGSVSDYIKIDNKDCAIDTDLSFKGSRYADSEDTPVMLVTYDGAKDYCTWKSGKDGCTYRLPREAEWEYAARGGRRSKSTRYAGSDNASNVAWTASNAGNKLHTVGTKSSNELFIYDMSGNVWEWCSDWYQSDYYSASDGFVDPKGPDDGVNRVIRGGSWIDDKEESAIGHRSNNSPDIAGVNLGFRIVREIP